MPQLAPPEPPPSICVAVDDFDWERRLRFRLWQVAMSALTILATCWLITLGAIPGILALLTAKHILVAILVMGLDVNRSKDQ
jgi:hypothetical protein